jgi:hypothetical protein
MRLRRLMLGLRLDAFSGRLCERFSPERSEDNWILQKLGF